MLSVFGSNGMKSESLESALTGGQFPPASFTKSQREAIGRWVVEFWGRGVESPTQSIFNFIVA
jgi:hypothetical protein